MGKAIGLLLAVVAIWITAEIYTQGVGQAFGGHLAALLGDRNASEAKRGSTTQRVGEAVGHAREEQDARYDKLIPE
jgi:hypothetical protein